MISLEYEEKYNFKLVGIDEAGRGPLVGPVYAAAASIKPDFNYEEVRDINDSKKLSEAKRKEIFNKVVSNFYIGIGIASVQEIDHLNILNATKLAMKRAYNNIILVNKLKYYILVDGNFTPFEAGEQDVNSGFLIKGDAKCLSIAAASIVAKVERDRIMSFLAMDFPNYNWENNKGYGTKSHIEAIKTYGITMHHRTSFVKNIVANKEEVVLYQ